MTDDEENATTQLVPVTTVSLEALEQRARKEAMSRVSSANERTAYHEIHVAMVAINEREESMARFRAAYDEFKEEVRFERWETKQRFSSLDLQITQLHQRADAAMSAQFALAAAVDALFPEIHAANEAMRELSTQTQGETMPNAAPLEPVAATPSGINPTVSFVLHILLGALGAAFVIGARLPRFAAFSDILTEAGMTLGGGAFLSAFRWKTEGERKTLALANNVGVAKLEALAAVPPVRE